MIWPTRKYEIIYADPPWSYYNDSSASPDCTTVKGMRRPPYSVLATAEIKKFPVEQIAADNSILFMWTTDYHLGRCIECMSAWSFTYKTVGFAWQKLNKAGNPVCFMGAYTMKSGIELCLLGTRGKDAHSLVQKHNIRSRIESQRLDHSRKPDEVKNRIVELLGDRPRIELFARQKTDGWDVWGNELSQ